MIWAQLHIQDQTALMVSDKKNPAIGYTPCLYPKVWHMGALDTHNASIQLTFKNSIFSVIDFGTTSHSKSDSTNGKPSPTTQKPVSSKNNQIHIFNENVDNSKNENSKDFYHQMTDKKATFSWSSANIISCHATILLPMLIIISQFIA